MKIKSLRSALEKAGATIEKTDWVNESRHCIATEFRAKLPNGDNTLEWYEVETLDKVVSLRTMTARWTKYHRTLKGALSFLQQKI